MNTETVLVDIIASTGTIRERVTLSDERRSFTIGRSVTADVVLDDPHAAALHAEVAIAADGQTTVRDLGSTNGVMVAGKRHHDRVALPAGSSAFGIGRTHIRVRTQHEALLPEQPDRHVIASVLQHAGPIAAGTAAVCLAQSLYSDWFGAPRDLAANAVMSIGVSAAVAAVWTAAWGLLTRIMLGEWHWLRHAAIFLGAVALYNGINAVLDFATFVLSLSPWTGQHTWLALLALGMGLYFHLINASSLPTRRAAMIATAVFAVLGGAGWWLDTRDTNRNVNLVKSQFRIYPSSWRLAGPESVDSYFRRAPALRAATDRRRDAVLKSDREDDSP